MLTRKHGYIEHSLEDELPLGERGDLAEERDRVGRLLRDSLALLLHDGSAEVGLGRVRGRDRCEVGLALSGNSSVRRRGAVRGREGLRRRGDGLQARETSQPSSRRE